jgi:hypothetical protein
MRAPLASVKSAAEGGGLFLLFLPVYVSLYATMFSHCYFILFFSDACTFVHIAFRADGR